MPGAMSRVVATRKRYTLQNTGSTWTVTLELRSHMNEVPFSQFVALYDYFTGIMTIKKIKTECPLSRNAFSRPPFLVHVKQLS